jgi:hypothetical protein
MRKNNFLFGATTFDQFKKRYLIFTIFLGAIFFILFLIRGFVLDIWRDFQFYQIISIIFIILYIIFSILIYNHFKKKKRN